MNDTPEAFRKLFHEKMMEHSPEERLALGAEMLESARRIVLASLPEDMPEEERRYAPSPASPTVLDP